MTGLVTADVNVIALIIIIVIFVNSYNRSKKGLLSYELFNAILLSNMALIVLNLLSWAWDGTPGSVQSVLNNTFNYLIFILGPAVPSLCVLYIRNQVSGEKGMKRAALVLASLLALNAVFTVLNASTGWMFVIDANNVYHRGQYFFVFAAYSYLLTIYSFLYVLVNRHLIEKRYFFALLLFFIPPVAGTVIQTIFYNVSYIWAGMAVSCLIIYINIQNKNLSTDHLTGAFNRRQLEIMYNAKLKANSFSEAFSALLIDIDELKQINDTFGHDAGDLALCDTVEIIKGCIKSSDIVARIGGDEFVVLLKTGDKGQLALVRECIERSVEKYNMAFDKPFKLSLSYGCDVYDPEKYLSADDFFKHIDGLMYSQKNSKRPEA